MKQVCNSEVSFLNLNIEAKETNNQDGRVFGYALNHKRAKSKLLKGAKRAKNLNVEVKSGCVNLRFDDGSYFEIILPLLREWHRRSNEIININNIEVKIIEVDAGIENTAKHVDTKLIVIVNGDRLVLHAYNGTQNLMVQGRNYENFAINYLQPFFINKIELAIDKITEFNNGVKDALGPTKVIQMKPDKIYSCPQCDIIAATTGDLKLHIKSCHTKPRINSPKKNKILKTLGEDSSLVNVNDVLMIELDGEDDNAVNNIKQKSEQNLVKSEVPKEDAKKTEESLVQPDVPKEDTKKTEESLVQPEVPKEDTKKTVESVIQPEEVLKEDIEKKDVSVTQPPDLVLEDLHSCNVCEFDTEIRTELEHHMRILHGMSCPPVSKQKKEEVKIRLDVESPEQSIGIVEKDKKEATTITEVETEVTNVAFVCGTCTIEFISEPAYRDHLGSHIAPQTYQCSECECSFKTELECEWHTETNHCVQQMKNHLCEKCDFKSMSGDDLNNHMQSRHLKVQVNINAKEQTVIACNECEFKCRLNIQMKKHMKMKHDESKYSCNECSFTTNYVANTWEHTVDQHPDKSLNFTKKEAENFILKLVAEQNADIGEGVDGLRNELKDAFEGLAIVVESTLNSIKEDTNDKMKTLADTVVMLHSKISKLESDNKRTRNLKAKSRHEKKHEKTDKPTEPRLPSSSPFKTATSALKPGSSTFKPAASSFNPASSTFKPASSSFNPASSTFKPAPFAEKSGSTTSTPASATFRGNLKPRTAFLSKPKILYVADSVGHSAEMRKLEISQNCRIKTAQAYSSVYSPAARWPNRNFTEVVRAELQNPGREHVDVMVLSAPTVDITNLDSSQLRPNDNTDAFQHQVIISCQNMINLAENSLRNNPGLAKVVILEHPPRFDTPDMDPTSLKPNLARLANSTFGQLWHNSPLKDKISIGQHSLESNGVGTAHFDRYQNQKTGRYDGVHFYNRKGRADFTNSLKTIFLLALSQLNPTQSVNGFGTAQGDNFTEAGYQRNFGPSVPTRNRFNVLNQGNY